MVHLPYYDTKKKGWCRHSRQLGGVVHASNSSTPEEGLTQVDLCESEASLA